MTIKTFTVPELPKDEAERQAALDAYRLHEAKPDPALDALVAEAAAAFGVPTALVSIVDQDRQWFPARTGMSAASTPRSISFCGHALNASEPLVVPDATADGRFAGNPLVLNEDGIRFYAGAPLFTPAGHPLGTLCLIDRKPRAPLTEAELARLVEFSKRAMQLLERANDARAVD